MTTSDLIGRRPFPDRPIRGVLCTNDRSATDRSPTDHRPIAVWSPYLIGRRGPKKPTDHRPIRVFTHEQPTDHRPITDRSVFTVNRLISRRGAMTREWPQTTDRAHISMPVHSSP